MLIQLLALQREVDRAVAAFENIVTGLAPDAATFAAARAQLGDAVTRKRLFIEAVVYTALARLPDADQAELLRFRRDSAEQLRLSTEHIAAWTIDRVLRDWEGYQGMSALVRASMRLHQAAERRVLYPLLERIDQMMAA